MGLTSVLPAFLVLLLSACASPQLLLEGRGDLCLARGGEQVRVSPGDELTVVWRDGGAERTTADLATPARRPARVRLVEASEQYLRLRADAWHDPADIPAESFGPEVRLIPRDGRYRRPTLLIPTALIAEVETYALLPGPHRPQLKDLAIGAVGGVVWSALALFSSDLPHVPEMNEGGTYLRAILVCGAAGAVLYPAFRILTPREAPVLHAIGRGDWQLRILRP